MEQQEARKSIDWFKVVFITENLLILLALMMLGAKGCEYMLSTKRHRCLTAPILKICTSIPIRISLYM